MDPLSSQLERVRAKLEQVSRRFAKRLRPAWNRYHLKRPLKERAIEQLERQHDIRLPEDFRLFITCLGNGGQGPGYGWSSFDPKDPWHQRPEWSSPWRNTNLLSDEEADAVEGQGMIELHDYGCGMFDFLVVTGPEAGTLWFSDSVCDVRPVLSVEQTQQLLGEVDLNFPSEAQSRILQRGEFPYRTTFLDHYEAWLDYRLAPGKGRRFL